MAEPNTFIEKRLAALHDIDCKIVSLLDGFSTVFETYTTPTRATDIKQNTEKKEVFEAQTKSVYKLISTVAIDLRKEVKIMDDNIGVYNKNEDQVMILPISVDQKNSSLGERKLKHELRQMDKVLGDWKSQTEVDIEPARALTGNANTVEKETGIPSKTEDASTDARPSDTTKTSDAKTAATTKTSDTTTTSDDIKTAAATSTGNGISNTSGTKDELMADVSDNLVDLDVPSAHAAEAATSGAFNTTRTSEKPSEGTDANAPEVAVIAELDVEPMIIDIDGIKDVGAMDAGATGGADFIDLDLEDI